MYDFSKKTLSILVNGLIPEVKLQTTEILHEDKRINFRKSQKK